MSRVLIISHDVVGKQMAGPAIRYWHLAQVLAADNSVQLATPGEPVVGDTAFEVVGYRRRDGHPLAGLASGSDCVVVAGFLLHHYPFLEKAGRPLVVDLYDPFILENLEIHRDKRLEVQADIHAANLAVLNEQLRLGDFFLCAHETQRDFWLGMLAANNRVNPHTLAADRTLRRLIDVAPFGLPAEPPQHRRQVLKGTRPGIGADDKIVYWGGGLWEWFDPLTAISAVAEIARLRGDVRLFFAGTKHPNPQVPPMRMCEAARQLSDGLGLTDRVVFFNDWVPYEERGDYLLEADVGVSLHFEQVETRYAFRTRVLDYIWAGLPMAITRGDTLSQLVAERGLGLAVPPADVSALRDALLNLLDRPGLRREVASRFAAVRADLTWDRVAGPLLAFCREPHFAADHLHGGRGGAALAGSASLPVRAWRIWRRGGIAALVDAAKVYLRWRSTA